MLEAIEARLRGFARSEDGALIVFGLMILVIMLAAAGLAVDTMRHERERARLQATLDRAVLAAADLQQTLTPQEVVGRYFAAAGLDHALGEITVEQGLNSRVVTAAAVSETPTVLMGLVGIDSLRAATAARAEERVTDVEISLVLDVSGSMAKHGRLTKLRRAAAEFVEMAMPEPAAAGDRGVTTISLVPYATSVNIGPELMRLYNVDRVHPYSNCVQFRDDDYDAVALPPSRTLAQYEHFDPYNGGLMSVAPPRIGRPLCPRAAEDGEDEVNALIPLGTDPDVLVRAVGALEAEGSTEIDVGMRWGVGMLDPQTRPVVDALVSAGTYRGASGRPLDYGTPDSIKVVVLMTDGDPKAPFDLHPRLKTTDPVKMKSNVWYDPENGRYSVLLRGHYLKRFPYSRADRLAPGASSQTSGTGDCDDVWRRGERAGLERDGVQRVAAGDQDDENCEPRWYWVGVGKVRDHPDWTHADPDEADPDRHPRLDGPNRDLVRLTYRELFDHAPSPLLEYYLYQVPRQLGWISSAEWKILRDSENSSWHRDGTASDTVDRLLRLCTAAKRDQKVTIYTIGFELDRIEGGDGESAATKRERARDLMRRCATSEKHFFDVEALEIDEAFRNIAGQIERLRLTR